MCELQEDNALCRGEVVETIFMLAYHAIGEKNKASFAPVHEDPEMAIEVILISLESLFKLQNARWIVGSGVGTSSFVAC